MKTAVLIVILIFSVIFSGCRRAPVIQDSSTDVSSRSSDADSDVIFKETAAENDTENIDIIDVSEKWEIFTVSGKPASYIYTNDYNPSDACDFIQVNDNGVWLLWCFLGDDWNIDDVYDICGIKDASSIESVMIRYKNVSSLDAFTLNDEKVFASLIDTLNSCSVLSIETWGQNHTLQNKNKNASKLVLYVDIHTLAGYTLNLQLYPLADCLVQNGECFFMLNDSDGEKLFRLFTGMSCDEFIEYLIY